MLISELCPLPLAPGLCAVEYETDAGTVTCADPRCIPENIFQLKTGGE